MGAPENECQISQNYILLTKFSEFYLYFHNSCEIWHSFSLNLALGITIKWPMLEGVAVSKDFRFFIFNFGLLRGYYIDHNTLQKVKCAQWPKELRLLSWLLVQLTGVDDICIKLRVTYNGKKEN